MRETSTSFRALGVSLIMTTACGSVATNSPKAAALEASAAQADYAGGPVPMSPEPEAAPAPGAPPVQAPAFAKDAPQSTTEPLQAGTLLIYEADFRLAVYGVEQALASVEGAARELGGHLVQRAEAHIVIRVPRKSFEEALRRIEAVGDVVGRNVRSQDVTDQYRDLETRLRNARVVRDRLAQLLERAQTVEESLKIERELGRVTEEIERLAGTIEQLAGRISFSKITVSFEARRSEDVPDQVLRLPFSWLNNLGLSPLFNLHE